MEQKTVADLDKMLTDLAEDGKIQCSKLLKIALEKNIPPKQLGEAANRLKIKITHCQLGCFP